MFGGWGFAPETEYIGIGVLWGLGPPKGVKKYTTVLAVIIRESLMFSNCECDSICAAEMTNHRFVVIKCVYSSSKYSKLVFRRGSAPDPAVELTTLPQTL